MDVGVMRTGVLKMRVDVMEDRPSTSHGDQVLALGEPTDERMNERGNQSRSAVLLLSWGKKACAGS